MDSLNDVGYQRSPSSMDVLATSLLIALVYVGYVVFHILKKYDKKYPPFAPGGMWKHLNMAINQQYPWWLLDVSNQLQNRVFQLSLPFSPMKHYFIVGEPNAFRSILTDPLTTKPARLYDNLRNITGGATIFTTGGREWHAKRKAASPAFSSNHVKRMTRVALEKTEEWIQDTVKGLNNKSSFDVGKEMLGIILSALSETAFEYEMSKNERDFFGEELELALTEFTRKAPSNPLRPLFGFLPERRRACLAVQNLRRIVLRIMTAYRNKKEPVTTGTVIQLIMESDAFPTDEERIAQLMEFLLVGHDTTAYNISWILLQLAKNPEEQLKLHESLSQLSPENWNSSEYLKRVIREGMRLFPVARSVRVIGRDIMTSSGMLPKSSICSLHFLLLFRNPDIFEDPNSYLPSRWENPTREMIDSFNPYSLGKHNCAGQSLAQAETFAVVARICTEFELSVECEGTANFSLTLKPNGARLRVCARCKKGLAS